jgi:hypothetical protein
MQVELLKAAGKAAARGSPAGPLATRARDDGWNAAEMLADDGVRAMLSSVRGLVDEDGPPRDRRGRLARGARGRRRRHDRTCAAATSRASSRSSAAR